MSKIDAKAVSRDAINKVNGIAGSVIALARVLAVDPKKLATALYEMDDNDNFRAEVGKNALAPAITLAKAEAKAKAEDC